VARFEEPRYGDATRKRSWDKPTDNKRASTPQLEFIYDKKGVAIRLLRNFTPSKQNVMARIAGIKFENDTKGNRRYVRIDLKKHSADITPFLEKVGAVEQDDFERRWAEGLTPEEFKKQMHEHIDSWDWSKEEGNK
jgi:hypothetical protein